VWEEKTAGMREQMAAIEAPKRKEIEDEIIYKYPKEVQDALAKRPGERTSFEWLMFHKARQYLDPNSHQYVAPAMVVVAKLKPEQKERWNELKTELDQFKHLQPGKLPLASAIADVSCEAPKTYLLNRGLYDQPGQELEPGFLQILALKPARIIPPSGMNSTGRRTALANVLTDPSNPLTARVMVNRLWHYHFGRGIVGTPSDFGAQGERPTHPALLDWLASEFVAPSEISTIDSKNSSSLNDSTVRPWSLKHIHR